MRLSITRIRPSTVVLVAAIGLLGGVLVVEERKATRLGAALKEYKRLSHRCVVDLLHTRKQALVTWANDTPLEQVIEQVKLATASPIGWPAFPLGVPIEVDPVGLERAGKSLRSPVPSPPAGVDLTLCEKLEAALRPLGLACEVRNASLVITSSDLADRFSLEDPEDESMTRSSSRST